jgi:predicted nucleic acid-binding protein
MYLVDTNVWLERLLDQDRSDEVRQFLDATPSDQLSITDFAFHSIGVVLSRLGQNKALVEFVQDAFVGGAVTLLHLAPDDIQRVVDVAGEFGLDFDDAYQYVTAEKHDLLIVSFDSDFDHTQRGRKTPGEVVTTTDADTEDTGVS